MIVKDLRYSFSIIENNNFSDNDDELNNTINKKCNEQLVIC